MAKQTNGFSFSWGTMSNNLTVGVEENMLVNRIRWCEWDGVIELLRTKTGKKEAHQKTQFSRFFPIHWACKQQDVPLKVINALLEAYPQGIQQKTEHGKLPIHFAVRNRCSVDVIKRLIYVHPEGLQQTKANDLNLPIHSAYPGGLLQRDNYGMLPIHYAVSSRSPSWDIIKILLESSPISIILSCRYEVAVEDTGNEDDTKEVAVLDEPEENRGILILPSFKTTTKHLMPSVLLSYDGGFRYLSRLERLAKVIEDLESIEQEYIVKLARAAVEHNEIEKKHGSTMKRKADVLSSPSTGE